MADQVNVSPAVVETLSLAIQVSEGLLRYYDSFKDQEDTARQATHQLETLLNTLTLLQDAVASRAFRDEDFQLLSTIESFINQCDDAIQELKQEYSLVQGSSGRGLKGSIRVAGHLIRYPFRKSTLATLDRNSSVIKHNISLAMDVLQLHDQQQQQQDEDDIMTVKQVTQLIQHT